jgi:acetoacetate decarboxylase
MSTPCIFDDDAASVGGRELWGFPKKLAQPKTTHEGEVIVGTLHYGEILCVTATSATSTAPHTASILATMQRPNFLLKVIPHVDGSPCICKLVRFHLEELNIKEAWHAPADLQLFPHVAADVAHLPVLEVISGSHFVADLALGYGEVVFDYLEEPGRFDRNSELLQSQYIT